MVWARSGNRCAFPDCNHELVVGDTKSDDESVIGDEAHIVAREPNGPRGDDPLPEDARDKFDNLILLCRIHHKIVDDHPEKYTKAVLVEFKRQHQDLVQKSLSFDKTEEIDLKYASLLDDLFQMYDIDNWKGWTSGLLSNGQPSISRAKLAQLQNLPSHVQSRFWPRKYEALEKSVHNLINVQQDLTKVFVKHADFQALDLKETQDDLLIRTNKFYRSDDWDENKFYENLAKFEYHVDLVEDLVLELTRAANLLIVRVRETINPMFREKEGKLVVESGPGSDLAYTTYLPEYKLEQILSQTPYNGLADFMTSRSNRDFHFGDGYSKDYFYKMPQY